MFRPVSDVIDELNEHDKEYVEERSAIREFDGGEERLFAEVNAYLELMHRKASRR